MSNCREDERTTSRVRAQCLGRRLDGTERELPGCNPREGTSTGRWAGGSPGGPPDFRHVLWVKPRNSPSSPAVPSQCLHQWDGPCYMPSLPLATEQDQPAFVARAAVNRLKGQVYSLMQLTYDQQLPPSRQQSSRRNSIKDQKD